MLLRYLEEPKRGTVRFSLPLFPRSDRLTADVQRRGEDRLGEGHLIPNSSDPLRDIPGRGFDLGLRCRVPRHSGWRSLAPLDPHSLLGSLDELLAKRALLLCLGHCSSSNSLTSFRSSFSSARVRSSFTPFA
jgi:hypothetical protein